MDTNDAQNGQKPQLFKKGGKPGPGRPKGSKDSISRMTKEDVASFFMECTAENVRWRKHIRQKLDDAIDPTEFHNLSRLALGYAIGLPTKTVERKEQKLQLTFATSHGYLPWDARAPAAAGLNARSVRLIEAKDQELLQALEAAKPDEVIIDVKKGDTEIDAEVLEVVVPPPEDPGAHGGGGRGR
jgi:hypothetical protein